MITTFTARSRWTILRLRVIHVAVHRSVRRRVPWAGPAAATLRLRHRTLVSVSLWDREEDLVRVGYSGAHVWAAHWAIEHGVTADSVVYRHQGRAQDLLMARLAGTPAAPRPPAEG